MHTQNLAEVLMCWDEHIIIIRCGVALGLCVLQVRVARKLTVEEVRRAVPPAPSFAESLANAKRILRARPTLARCIDIFCSALVPLGVGG